jgi:DNA polymerase III delta prime subunit
MALRGVKPSAVKKRLKVLFYGAPGVGKTTAAIQFPSPYLIDTERGAENKKYVDLLEESKGFVFQTGNFEEIVKETKSLLTDTHEFKTLIIDSLTTVYTNLLDNCIFELKNSSKEKDATGTEFGRHYVETNRKMRRLIDLLLRLDMNVIITSHAKNEYAGNMTVIGSTYDCYKKIDYLFDLSLEVQKRGDKRVGIVKKTRIEGFPDGDNIDFCYSEIAKRYGIDILEKKAESQKLATEEQVDKIKHLVGLLKIPPETSQKWLEKSNADSFEEMSEGNIQDFITRLEDKINGKAAAQKMGI